MPTFTVQYVYDPDRPDALDAVRPEHRAYLAEQVEAGALLVSGPFRDGAPGALLVLDVTDEEAAGALLDGDPFWRAGLVVERTVRRWEPVLGSVG